jgi:hypothetical protein
MDDGQVLLYAVSDKPNFIFPITFSELLHLSCVNVVHILWNIHFAIQIIVEQLNFIW